MAIIHDEATFDDYLLGTLPSWCPPTSRRAIPTTRPARSTRCWARTRCCSTAICRDAIEVDVDCLCDGKDVFIAGIMEHIEEAGIHSGDSACSLPPHSLSPETIAELERQTRALALALDVGGLMNVQYALKDGDIYVLEVNPRASRTVPFVAKVIGEPDRQDRRADHGGRDAGELRPASRKALDHIAVKEAVFPFARFPGVDTLLGPEMRSTGEVIGLDRSLRRRLRQEPARRRHQGAARAARCSSRCATATSRASSTPMQLLAELGFKIVATSGTQRFLADEGVQAARDQQGAGRPAAYRRRDQERRDPAGLQHHRGRAGARRQSRRCAARPSCIRCPITPR